MREPDVEDTGGVDRGTFRVPLGPWLVRHVSLLRIRVAPWLENRHTAERWLYTLFVVGTPPGGGGANGFLETVCSRRPVQSDTVVPLRGNLDSRCADVATLT